MEGPTLGQKIRAARKSRRMTQRELSGGVVSTGFISMVEHDRVRPSLATLQLISERLGEPLTSFVNAPPPPRVRVEMVLRRAEGLLRQHRFSEAVETFSRIEASARESGDVVLQIRVRLGLSQGLTGLRQFDLARLRVDEALTLAGSSNTWEWRAAAEHALAFIAFRSRRFEDARLILQDSLGKIDHAGDTDRDIRGKLHALLGRTLIELGLPALALESFRAARDHLSRAADPSHEALLQYNMGIAYEQEGSLDRAREHLERAAHLFRMHENLHLLSVAIRSLGILHLHAGEAEEARAALQQSLHLCEQLADDEGRAQTLVELARARVALGQIDEARRAAEDARSLATRISDEAEASRAEAALGEAATADGRLDDAARHLAAAVQAFDRLKMSGELARASRDLGFVLMAGGDMRGAATHFAKALTSMNAIPVIRGWSERDESG